MSRVKLSECYSDELLKPFKLPEHFTSVLEDITKAVLQHQPKNLYKFMATYTDNLILKTEIFEKPMMSISKDLNLSGDDGNKLKMKNLTLNAIEQLEEINKRRSEQTSYKSQDSSMDFPHNRKIEKFSKEDVLKIRENVTKEQGFKQANKFESKSKEQKLEQFRTTSSQTNEAQHFPQYHHQAHHNNFSQYSQIPPHLSFPGYINPHINPHIFPCGPIFDPYGLNHVHLSYHTFLNPFYPPPSPFQNWNQSKFYGEQKSNPQANRTIGQSAVSGFNFNSFQNFANPFQPNVPFGLQQDHNSQRIPQQKGIDNNYFSDLQRRRFCNTMPYNFQGELRANNWMNLEGKTNQKNFTETFEKESQQCNKSPSQDKAVREGTFEDEVEKSANSLMKLLEFLFGLEENQNIDPIKANQAQVSELNNGCFYPLPIIELNNEINELFTDKDTQMSDKSKESNSSIHSLISYSDSPQVFSEMKLEEVTNTDTSDE